METVSEPKTDTQKKKKIKEHKTELPRVTTNATKPGQGTKRNVGKGKEEKGKILYTEQEEKKNKDQCHIDPNRHRRLSVLEGEY